MFVLGIKCGGRGVGEGEGEGEGIGEGVGEGECVCGIMGSSISVMVAVVGRVGGKEEERGS